MKENMSYHNSLFTDKEQGICKRGGFLLSERGSGYKCEIKLMGRGNPESADAVIARSSKVFVADKLSAMNKKQLDSLNVQWVELRSSAGFRRYILMFLTVNHLKT